MGFLSHLGPKSSMLDVILRKRRRYKHMDAFTHQLLRGPSELSFYERELLATFVSALNACTYCTGVHHEVALIYGIKPALLSQLIDDMDKAPIDDRLIPILKYVKKLTLTPSKAVQTDVDHITAAGWSEKTVEDVVAITAIFNYYNRLMDGLGIKGTPDLYNEGATFLTKRGYGIPGIVAWYLRKFRLSKDDSH